MNLEKIVNKVARCELIATKIAFTMTQSEWKVYRKEHPAADPTNHKIIKDTIKKQLQQESPEKQKLQAPNPHEIPEIKVHPKHQVKISKEHLEHTLSKGHYSIISAGRNPNNPEEAKLKPDDEFFHKRHLQLQQELEDMGAKYTEVVGNYGGKESTFMVFHDDTPLTKKTQKSFLVHHNPDDKKVKTVRDQLNQLGKRYGQDSVLHGEKGKNYLYFTTGKHEGDTCGGKGWKEVPEAEDFYTDIELKNKNHTKFTTNIDECFQKGYL